MTHTLSLSPFLFTKHKESISHIIKIVLKMCALCVTCHIQVNNAKTTQQDIKKESAFESLLTAPRRSRAGNASSFQPRIDPQCLLTNGKLPLWAKRLVSLPREQDSWGWHVGDPTPSSCFFWEFFTPSTALLSLENSVTLPVSA